MKLRVYIFFIVLGVFAASFFVTSSHTNAALKDAIDDVNQRELTKAHSYLQAIINSKKEKIEQFTDVMEEEKELESIFNFSAMSYDWTPFHQKLARLKEESKFDVVEFISNEGASMEFGNDRKQAIRILDEAATINDKIQVLPWGKKIAVVSVTPLKVRGKVRGRLFMGTLITDAMEKRISELTKSRVKFLLEEAPSKESEKKEEKDTFELMRSGKRILKVRIELDQAFLDALGKKTKVKLAKASALVFALGCLLLWFLAEIGFLRRIEDINRATNEAADHLDEGKIEELPVLNHPIREMNSLSHSLSKFSKSIRAYDEKVKEQAKIAVQAKEREAISRMAEQVAHDLKSPVLSLSSLVNTPI